MTPGQNRRKATKFRIKTPPRNRQNIARRNDQRSALSVIRRRQNLTHCARMISAARSASVQRRRVACCSSAPPASPRRRDAQPGNAAQPQLRIDRRAHPFPSRRCRQMEIGRRHWRGCSRRSRPASRRDADLLLPHPVKSLAVADRQRELDACDIGVDVGRIGEVVRIDQSGAGRIGRGQPHGAAALRLQQARAWSGSLVGLSARARSARSAPENLDVGTRSDGLLLW